MDKKKTTLSQMTRTHNDDYVPGTPEERINLVWELTKEACSLSNKYDAEQRLQRHITRLIRRKS